MKNAVLDEFNKILQEGRFAYLRHKKASLLREFFQVKILEKVYKQKLSAFIYFVGGTSLRILRGLDRFSEDLDFDLDENISLEEVEEIFDNLVDELQKENILVEPYKNRTEKRIYFELRFPEILYVLGLSPHKEEKMVIKLDFDSFWKGLKREVVVVDRFYHLFKVVTLPLNQILVQKMYAYLYRKQTLPRDIYDIVWLLKQGAVLDWRFIYGNFIKDLTQKVAKKFAKEKERLPTYINRLKPLLEDPNEAEKIAFFDYYFPIIKSIEYKGYVEHKEYNGTDSHKFVFSFLVNGSRKVELSISVSSSALASENDVKKLFKEKFFIEKMKQFLLKNPLKNYEIGLISTINKHLLFLGEFEELIA